jgi:hypothetical protein
MRRNAYQSPRTVPWRSMASMAYCEHVGWNLQVLAGRNGETIAW